jgi:hypothetical protein
VLIGFSDGSVHVDLDVTFLISSTANAARCAIGINTTSVNAYGAVETAVTNKVPGHVSITHFPAQLGINQYNWLEQVTGGTMTTYNNNLPRSALSGFAML